MREKLKDRTSLAEAMRQVETKKQQVRLLQSRWRMQLMELSEQRQSNASILFRRKCEQFDREFAIVVQGLENLHAALVETQRQFVQWEDDELATVLLVERPVPSFTLLKKETAS